MTQPLTPYVRSLIRDSYAWASRDLELGEKLWGLYSGLRTRPHPMGDFWEAALAHYYGSESLAGSTAYMSRRGEQGQIAAIRINRARRVSKARQALILAGFIKLRAVCGNMDAKSAYAKALAELLLDHDFRRGGIDNMWAQWVELAEVFGSAYTFTRWCPWAGRDIGRDPDTGMLVREGDLVTELCPPWLVEFDDSYPTVEQSPWNFVLTFEPKTDLVLAYRSTLRTNNADEVAQAIWDSSTSSQFGNGLRIGEADRHTACVLNAIHYPSPLLPQGLWLRMLDSENILERRALIGPQGDYDETGPRAVIPMQADVIAGSPHPWAPFWNVLAAQELSDALLTTHASLVTTCTDPVYAVPAGTANNPEKLTAGPGRKWVMGPGDKPPFLLERPEVKESALNFDEVIASEMQADMALNDSVTGQSEGTEKNAQAEALRASQAVQQVAPAAKSARTALARLFELRLKTLRKNASGERMLSIVGQAKKHLLLTAQTYTPDQLAPFEGVEFEDGNPMEATPQGRWAVVQLYQELGLVKSIEDVDLALGTGRLDPVVDPIRDENKLILWENDAIRRGELPRVYVTQNHVLHMRKHDCVTMTPTALDDDALMSAHDAHWNEHYAMEFGIDPRQDPLLPQRRKFVQGLGPPPMAPMGPPGAPPGAPVGGPPPPDAGGAPPGAGGGGGEGAPAPEMPPNGPAAVEPPTNPLNGEQFSNTAPPMGAAA